jgi:hypothetical protein
MLTPTCDDCGTELTDTNTACHDCDRCHDCMPGDCFECRQLRTEDQADWMTRYTIENEVCS